MLAAYSHIQIQIHGIPLYDQSEITRVKSLEFRRREILYCREGNTMLLRDKYDVLINVTWDCYDQSNFYISGINSIEWNNIHLFPLHQENMTISRVNTFSYLPYACEMNDLFHQANVLMNSAK